MAVRSAMQRAGAMALTELLQFPVPAAISEPSRSKTLLTAVGKVEVPRPYYLWPHCRKGQCPADCELDVEHTTACPGVRRMLATVGQAAPFDQGRRQTQQVDAAVNLSLPIVRGEPIPVLFIEMDGTGVPVVKAETEGRQARLPTNPLTLVKPNSAVFSRRQHRMREATPSAIRAPPPIPAPSKPPPSLATGSIWKPGIEAGALPSL
jgi:hypothetical protein